MTKFDDIRAADDVDAPWLTAVLHAAGLARGATVTGLAATSIGTGQVGENVRFDLTWSPVDAPGPSSVVGKFPSASDISRTTAQQLDTYTREIGFYRDLQSLVTISSPLVHHVGWNPDTHEFVIVMADISPADQGDQLGGCSVAEARLALDEAVNLHAPMWGRTEELAELRWLGQPDLAAVAERANLFTLVTPGFVERFADRLAGDVLDLARRLVDGMVDWAAEVAAWAETHGGWCLVHGDYRLDNMLFGRASERPLTVVDWQTVAIGTGPSDVAYFCGAGLIPEVRAEHERELVMGYAAGLRAAGVDVAAEAVWDGYVLGSASGLYMAVIASQVVERTERGDEMFAVMAERHADQIRTVGLMDRLGMG